MSAAGSADRVVYTRLWQIVHSFGLAALLIFCLEFCEFDQG